MQHLVCREHVEEEARARAHLGRNSVAARNFVREREGRAKAPRARPRAAPRGEAGPIRTRRSRSSPRHRRRPTWRDRVGSRGPSGAEPSRRRSTPPPRSTPGSCRRTSASFATVVASGDAPKRRFGLSSIRRPPPRRSTCRRACRPCRSGCPGICRTCRAASWRGTPRRPAGRPRSRAPGQWARTCAPESERGTRCRCRRPRRGRGCRTRHRTP
mmetsp:Transcript_105267/g.294981  ORF Transcript_105267/g.294981 Transcript_105267/m.294981 type:complete len:214 (-) Transcript_105267:828-1469(-)